MKLLMMSSNALKMVAGKDSSTRPLSGAGSVVGASPFLLVGVWEFFGDGPVT